MVTKAAKHLKTLSLLLLLAIFPFGQVPTLLLSFVSPSLHIFQLLDLFVILFVAGSFFSEKTLLLKLRNSYWAKFLLTIGLCSLIGVFQGFGNPTSGLYLVRLLSYSLFAFCLWEDQTISKLNINQFLIALGIVIVVLGLSQYFLLPDVRALKALGWDDHYFRLVGTFFDPAYIGILFVFTLLFTLYKNPNNWKRNLFVLFLLLCILVTYSRATYLSLGIGLVVMRIQSVKLLKQFSLLAMIFGVCLVLLPRPASEGVKLERTFSIVLRAQNYRETFEIIRENPLFGVGYNNICSAKERKSLSLISHSCSGADNSVLFFIATTGVVGLISGMWGVKKLWETIPKGHRTLFVAIISSTLVHSFFSNTLFYPWVIIWIALLVRTFKDYK